MPVIVITFALVGAALGVGSGILLGLGVGAVIGYLLSRLSEVQRALNRLQATLDAQRSAPPAVEKAAPDRPEAQAATPTPSPATDGATGRREPLPAADVIPRRPEPVPPAAPRSAPSPAAPRHAPPPDLFDRAWQAGHRWLTTGNIPVKVGVIISFFGVAFLLKYAVDRNLFVVPIELRLLGVAAGAGVLLGIGWRLRRRNAVYALSLQGGGIGVLYLTIFAAFRLYALLPATAAFGLLVVLTAAAGTLAVLQNAPGLAILGSVGGFLAPVLVSTGQGSHVALFSYYLLLNAAILGISWYRAWQGLNLIGFVFTFGVGTLWGYEYYRPELYASTQPFLVLNFLFYQAIAVLFAFRQPPNLRGLVDGTIVFGTPVIAFALQAALVEDTEYGLAISAAVVAIFYAALAAWLYRRDREQLGLLGESFAVLGVAFATIAVPLALDARWTAAAWALEGAALVWVGVRQHGVLARLSGAALLVAGGLAFIEGGWQPDAGIAVLNGNVLGGFLVAGASLFAAHRLQADGQPHQGQREVSVGLLLWGLIWWLGTGAMEIDERIAYDDSLPVHTLFLAASAAAFAWLAHRLAWAALRHATLAYLPLLVLPLGAWYLFEHGHLFVGAGWVAWPLAMAVHYAVLYLHDRGSSGQGAAAWHSVGALLLAAAIGIEAYWRVDDAGLGNTWAEAAALVAMLLPAWLILALRDRLAWPLRRYWNHYLAAAGTLVALQLVLLLGAGIEHPGDPTPLPYIPVLNPFDVLMLVALGFGFRFLLLTRDSSEGFEADRLTSGTKLWAAAAFLLTTVAVVRGVHHLAGVPWSGGALMRSVSVQAALSIYWGILAFAGMVSGARHARRIVWLTGTALMALVVVKLFLVDLGNTGTVARIISFLGVGALLLIVGYFAPAPPKPGRAEAAKQQT
jgi:uncharacterized membrane protein